MQSEKTKPATCLEQKADTVVVTGFGPFDNFKVNASWEAVKALREMPEVARLPVKLLTEEVPVSYDQVMKTIPAIVERENPLLMVHVGVSPFATKLTLEKCAKKDGYKREDVHGNCPKSNSCALGEEKCEVTTLNLEKLIEEFNGGESGVVSCTSNDAGRYLCEFIYYTSLSLNKGRSIFVHVPDVNKPYSAEQSARGLYEVISLALKQLKQDTKLVEENTI